MKSSIGVSLNYREERGQRKDRQPGIDRPICVGPTVGRRNMDDRRIDCVQALGKNTVRHEQLQLEAFRIAVFLKLIRQQVEGSPTIADVIYDDVASGTMKACHLKPRETATHGISQLAALNERSRRVKAVAEQGGTRYGSTIRRNDSHN